jgi:alkanesulfonate monooxygenase SsuD/methylene tetrahydromethanopterin reductase-like flavin-dependent oxidoreductase (luciferase family)
MTDLSEVPEMGAIIDPSSARFEVATMMAQQAEAFGFDYVCVYDHPYWPSLDAWTLLAAILSRTERIRGLTNVLNVPLRGFPAMIAKQAASLDVLSGGRVELGLGAGALPAAVGALGGPVREPRQSTEALGEAVHIIRLFWSGEPAKFDGSYYSIDLTEAGPLPMHPIRIVVGAYRPQMLDLVGRMADGWIPSIAFAPPERISLMQRRIDDAAAAAGRDPKKISRMYNLAGTITAKPAVGLLEGPVNHWIEQLTEFVTELGFDTFHFGYEVRDLKQFERFAREVIPGVREAVASRRSS